MQIDTSPSPQPEQVTMTATRVLTVHSETSVHLQLALLDAIESALVAQGAVRFWIDPASPRDLVVVAEFDDTPDA